MYSLLKKVLITISDIESVFSPSHPNARRWQLLRDYLRLRVKASLNRWFHFKHERFLSYYVEFPDYEIFFVEFRQIFVLHAYHFRASHSAPRIIDCGGNIGMSVLYFKHLYPDSSITIFEPSREVLPAIRSNIERNKLHNVTLIEKAVNGKNSTANMPMR